MPQKEQVGDLGFPKEDGISSGKTGIRVVLDHLCKVSEGVKCGQSVTSEDGNDSPGYFEIR